MFKTYCSLSLEGRSAVGQAVSSTLVAYVPMTRRSARRGLSLSGLAWRQDGQTTSGRSSSWWPCVHPEWFVTPVAHQPVGMDAAFRPQRLPHTLSAFTTDDLSSWSCWTRPYTTLATAMKSINCSASDLSSYAKWWDILKAPGAACFSETTQHDKHLCAGLKWQLT